MNAMSFSELTLEQLGAHADAHYKAGEKANQRANDQGMSCGLYLAEAKRRIDKETLYGQRTEAFEVFLRDHCPSVNAKGRARAYQLISIATGKTTEVAVAQDRRERDRANYKRKRETIPTHVRKVPPEPDPHADLLARITAKLAKLSINQLHAVERIIPMAP
ncbi:hypothetical protein [Mesorhizobium cantuariense]|uniref:Uncharacterized protein n=1 Tax=Mesorhizobium cantuariense TaxID=1300275 RepID=A0ABV7MRP2_9HYPH